MRNTLAAILAAALLALGPATAPVPAAAASTAAPPIKVSGDHLVNATTGATFYADGVNEASWANECTQGSRTSGWDGSSAAQAAVPVQDWAGVNMVRIHLNEDCWLGINGLPALYSYATYRSAVETAVSAINAAGGIADVVLAWNAPGTTKSLGQGTMCDTSHCPAFWNSVASVFGSNRSVIFELYSEPRPDGGADNATAATCVKNGGPAGGVCASYKTTGLQQITKNLRKDGAQNVILEGGPQSEQDPYLWADYKVTDPLNDVAASWHTYPHNVCNTTSCWNSDIKPVADQVPVIVSEVGDSAHISTGCTYTYSPAVTAWTSTIDNGAITPEAFVWDPFGACDNLTTDLSTGAPTSPYGSGWKGFFASDGASP